MSVCVCVCLFVCPFTFESPFNGLFAPTSRSQMSNIFRDSESLRKSNGKKWSNIWTFLFGNGLKSPRKKKFFCCWFCGLYLYITASCCYITASLKQGTASYPYNRLNFNITADMRVITALSHSKSCVGYKRLITIYPLLWHRCYYPHRFRDALSPVCGFFFNLIPNSKAQIYQRVKVYSDIWKLILSVYYLILHFTSYC